MFINRVLLLVITIISFPCLQSRSLVPFQRNVHFSDAKVCQTPECAHVASYIAKNMDPYVNPCDDFYNFSCGQFQKNVDSSNILFQLTNLTMLRLKSLLTNEIDESDIPPLQKAKNFYKSCVDAQHSQTDPIYPIYQKIEELGGWPLPSKTKEDENVLLRTLQKARHFGFESNSILALYILPDAKNTNTRRLVVTPPVLNLPTTKQNKMVTSVITMKYFDLMTHIGSQFARYSTLSKLKFHQYIREVREMKLRAREVLELELALVKIFPASRNGKEEDVFEVFDNLTISEIQKRYPFMNWLDFLQSQLGPEIHLNDKEYVIVSDSEYFKDLHNLFTRTSKSVIINYVVWHYVFYSLQLSMVFNLAERWRDCLAITVGGFNAVLSPKFVRNYFPGENRTPVVDMVRRIRKIMYDTLSNYDWIDNLTRKNILEKIDRIRVRVAYSEEMLNSDLEYTELYSRINSTDYYNSALNLSKFVLDFFASTLRSPINKDEWPYYVSTLAVNAFYVSIENSITIPAALLQKEFYSVGRPQFFNYGTAGLVIGHELSHAFDDMGRNFDKDGARNTSWWSLDVIKKYDEKSQCFVDQYNNYIVDEIGKHVNGRMTLSENIADSEGIIKAYKAYQSWVAENGEEELLPGLKYTPQQLFWISAANVWCKKQSPVLMNSALESDPHSPARYRVIGMLSNQATFAKDFSCPPQSNMNPAKKCVL